MDKPKGLTKKTKVARELRVNDREFQDRSQSLGSHAHSYYLNFAKTDEGGRVRRLVEEQRVQERITKTVIRRRIVRRKPEGPAEQAQASNHVGTAGIINIALGHAAGAKTSSSRFVAAVFGSKSDFAAAKDVVVISRDLFPRALTTFGAKEKAEADLAIGAIRYEVKAGAAVMGVSAYDLFGGDLSPPAFVPSPYRVDLTPPPLPADDFDRRAIGEARQAVIARPDDDAPRVAFALIARSTGNVARADLIEAQLRVAAGRAEVGDPTAVRSLLASHGPKWAREELGDTLVDRARGVWRRGFLERVEIDATTFVKQAHELFKRVPVRAVAIRTLDGTTLHELLQREELGRLRALSLNGVGLSDQAARELSGATLLSNLRWLDLSDNEIGDDGVRALAASHALCEVSWIGLDRNPSRLVPRVGGIDHGVVLDTSWPDEILHLPSPPAWLQREPASKAPRWFEA